MNPPYKQVNDSVWSFGDSLFMPGPNWSLGNPKFLPGRLHDTVLPDPVYQFNLDSAIAKARKEYDGAFTLADTVTYVPSILGDSPYKSTLKQPVAVNKQSPVHVILSAFILISFLLFALARVVEWNRIQLFFKSIFNTQALHRFMDTFESPLAPPVPIFYLATNFTIAGFAIANYADAYLQASMLQTVAITAGVVLGVNVLPLIRAAIIRLLGTIFELQTYAGIHVYISYLSQALLALFILPFFLDGALELHLIPSVVDEYVPLVAGVVLVYQCFRFFNVFPIRGVISIFYIILYLCTLEIIPLLILFKLFELT